MRKPGGSAVAAHARALPLSRVQSAFWLADMLSGAGESLAFGLDFDRHISVSRLDHALSVVVARHPLLRGRVTSGPEGLRMVVEHLPDSILVRMPPEPGSLEAWCAEPLSLRSWPLCRAAISVDRDGARLRIVVHHAVFDGESKDVFLRDLASAYRRDPPSCDAPMLMDAPFWRSLIERERQAVGSEAAPGGAVETDRPPARSARDASSSESLGFALDSHLRALVDQVARRLAVSKFTVHLAAWHAVLSRLEPSDANVVTAIALSTRDAVAAGEIGPFVNQLPVRSTSTLRHTFASLAVELADNVRRVAANRLEPPSRRDQADGARPDVAISYRRSALGDLQWPDAVATPVLLPPLPAATGSHVVIRMVHDGDATRGRIDTDRTSRPDGFAEQLKQHWLALLDAGARHIDVPISKLALGGST